MLEVPKAIGTEIGEKPIDNTCLKTQVAMDNQQEIKLVQSWLHSKSGLTQYNQGYFLGCMAGDGYYCGKPEADQMTLGMEVKDLEFVEKFVKICGEVLGTKPKKISTYLTNTVYSKGTKMYRAVLYNTALCRALVKRYPKDSVPRLTTNKAIRGYLEGFFDSEGTVTRMHYKTGGVQYGLTLDNTNQELLTKIHCLYKKLGVTVSKLYSYKAPPGKDCYAFSINLVSFFNSGFRIVIKRKIAILQECLASLRSSTTTRRKILGYDTLKSSIYDIV